MRQIEAVATCGNCGTESWLTFPAAIAADRLVFTCTSCAHETVLQEREQPEDGAVSEISNESNPAATPLALRELKREKRLVVRCEGCGVEIARRKVGRPRRFCRECSRGDVAGRRWRAEHTDAVERYNESRRVGG